MKQLKTAILAAALAGSISGAAQAQDRILIGSSSSSSSHYGYYVAVSQIINDNVEGVSATVVETGATMDNLRRLQRDQIDMGLVTTNVAYDAWSGQGEFEGQPYKMLTLWVYSSAPQNVVVREDAGLATLSDLAGQRINPGITGSATEKTTEAVFAQLGIEPEWVRGSTGDVVDSIKDDRAVGYVKSGAGERLDASSLDIATLTPITLLSLDDEQAKSVADGFPNLAVIEIGEGAAGDGYPAYRTWAFGTATVAHPEMSDDMAYAITKAAVEDETVQASAFASLKGSQLPAMTMSLATSPLHPGAIRYFEEIGVEVPDRLRP
ncbi:TAXI family TRAP transporter solute-binding subunit [Mesorhizobium sp. CAU 1741]|uniref:TAXI family TRAP transporter solute-binding subunit n=1 Tax=Mesorhizobium sp. CAU 1741 TaxID=3140366 RepID=UPI00325B7FB4